MRYETQQEREAATLLFTLSEVQLGPRLLIHFVTILRLESICINLAFGQRSLSYCKLLKQSNPPRKYPLHIDGRTRTIHNASWFFLSF